MFGGFGSCLDGMGRWLGPKDQVLANVFRPAKEMGDAVNAEQNRKTPYLMSCYERTRFLRYVLAPDGDDGEVSVKTGTVEDMANDFNETLGALENPANIVLVGHSWGGWTSMKMASLIDPSHKISAQVTLDPIDREQCGPIQVTASLTGWGGLDCRRAPLPMTAAERTGTWLNYYQTKFFALHSGPIESASTNVEKHFNLRTNDLGHHNMFLRDPEVIDSVVNLVQGENTNVEKPMSPDLQDEPADSDVANSTDADADADENTGLAGSASSSEDTSLLPFISIRIFW